MKNGISAKGQVVRSICRPYRWQIILLSVLTVLQSVCQVALAVLMRFVIDSAVNKDDNLAFWGIVFVADIILLIVLYCVVSWLRGSATDRFSGTLRQDILQSAVFDQARLLNKEHSGVLLSRAMEDVHTVCDGAINVLPSLIGQIARLIAAVTAVVLLYPPLAIVLLIAVAVVGLGAAWLRPKMRKHHRRVRRTDEQVMAAMQEDFQQLELIQSLQIQQTVLERFDGKIKESLAEKFARRIWSVGGNGLIHTLMQVGAGALLLWGAAQLSVGALSYGTLFSMLQLASVFRGPALGLSALWTRFAAIDVAAERLQDLLKPSRQAAQTEQDIRITAIVFDAVTFTYSGETTPVLEHFSKRLPLDDWSCLTGFSGRGKSTMFKLILGLYTPQSGKVYLETSRGNIPCSEETRNLFAYVPQDYALFSGTVLENLQLVAPNAEQTTYMEVLKAAQAEFVLEMPEGLQTPLSENNTGLSMGQLQRIAIARALLMDRPVLLLDECTSALDAQTEKAVLEALKATGRQAILVTHRPETLENICGVTAVAME
ncbi:MAG: ABC transporter ATP-binding protein [Oscillospiraceae bacterium]|nr:ABC transporter ATP-binding protein [Oscillospiraceae bacterium]